MPELREVLEAKRRQAAPPADAFERLTARRRSRAARRRLGSAALALSLAGAALATAFVALRERAVPTPVASPGQLPRGAWADDVPAPPASFGFRPAPRPLPSRGAPIWTVTKTEDYLGYAVPQAAEVLAWYRHRMPEEGWKLAWESLMGSMSMYGQVPTTYLASQTWTRAGRTVRLGAILFQSALPTFDLTLSEVPVSMRDQTSTEALPGEAGRLGPPDPGAAPNIEAERALMLASFFGGIEASAITERLARREAPSEPTRLVWVITYEPCPGCEATRPRTLVIDATTGRLVLRFVGSGSTAEIET
jgi:hypothetical protein